MDCPNPEDWPNPLGAAAGVPKAEGWPKPLEVCPNPVPEPKPVEGFAPNPPDVPKPVVVELPNPVLGCVPKLVVLAPKPEVGWDEPKPPEAPPNPEAVAPNPLEAPKPDVPNPEGAAEALCPKPLEAAAPKPEGAACAPNPVLGWPKPLEVAPNPEGWPPKVGAGWLNPEEPAAAPNPVPKPEVC